jgi:1-acyl-sn-glycerol-3-phosphate acyltransferase
MAQTDYLNPGSPWENFGQILRDRQLRLTPDGSVLARCLLGFRRRVNLDVSAAMYRVACEQQLKYLCLNKWDLRFEGIEHIDKDSPSLFVMKHRGFADITLHGFGYMWGTSGLHLEQPTPWQNPKMMSEILLAGKSSRFVMKEDLLALPIGLHLVMNGGIPVPQDLETKALNNPGFDPKDPKVLAQQKKMSTWFNFKDSYREIINTLKNNGSVMIYGEATRVSGDRMGHLSLRMIERLCKAPRTRLIPVGTSLTDGVMTVRYGEPCGMNDLRDRIAELSKIPKSNYI